MKTLLLSKTDVQNAVSMDDVIVAVEEAYKAYQQGQVEQPPIQGMEIPEHNAESDVKSCYNHANHMFSIKTVGLFKDNIKGPGKFAAADGGKLPNMMGNVVLGDGETGGTLAIMDASLITGIRLASLRLP